jgi:hypothetical protein
LSNFDEPLGQGQDLADFQGGNTTLVQRAREFCRGVRRYRNQKTARSLGIKKDRLQIFWDAIFVVHDTFSEFAVRFEAARDVAGTYAFESASE